MSREESLRGVNPNGKRPDGALPLFIGEGDHEVVMGCKRVFFEEHESHE